MGKRTRKLKHKIINNRGGVEKASPRNEVTMADGLVYSRECATCKHVLTCKGKPAVQISCINYEKYDIEKAREEERQKQLEKLHKSNNDD